MKDNMKRAPFSTQIDLSKFDMKDFAKASDEEKRQQEVMGESTTFFKDGLKRLRKNPLAMGSIIVLVLLILVILLAPKIVPPGCSPDKVILFFSFFLPYSFVFIQYILHRLL